MSRNNSVSTNRTNPTSMNILYEADLDICLEEQKVNEWKYSKIGKW